MRRADFSGLDHESKLLAGNPFAAFEHDASWGTIETSPGGSDFRANHWHNDPALASLALVMSNRIPIPTMKTRRNILIAVSLFFALAASPPAFAASACTPQQRSEILALFEQWDRSLATGNAATVNANYAGDAILIPTLSNEIRQSSARRIAYFRDDFLPKRPRGKIDKCYVRCFGNIAINSGLYTFTFGDGSKAQARYTFVYQKQSNGGWLIVEHHSSKMPQP